LSSAVDGSHAPKPLSLAKTPGIPLSGSFYFGGRAWARGPSRTYLAINLAVAGFLDTQDLLLDITGATGTIGGSNFVT
jgi:hypothetical protein